MDKIRIVIILSVLFALASLALIEWTSNKNSNAALASTYLSPQREATEVPDYVVYDYVFHKVELLAKRTRELRAQGVLGEIRYFPLQREGALSDAQASALQTIALACREALAKRDELAKSIVIAYQSKFPDGRVPKSGPPAHPPELEALQQERNAIILHARDQLLLALGKEDFARFDNSVKFQFGANTAAVSIDPIK